MPGSDLQLCLADPAARHDWNVHGSAGEGILLADQDEAAALSLERDRSHGWVLLTAATSESCCCRSELWGIAIAVLGCVCVTPAWDRGLGQGCH